MQAYKIVATAVMLSLAGSLAASASERGSTEIRLDGSIQNVSLENSDRTSISAQLVLNQYFSDYFSMGLAVRPSGQTTSYDDHDEEEVNSQLFLLARADIYLAGPASTVVPYFGGHGGLISYRYESGGQEENESVITYGGQLGLKIFASERTSFNIELDLSIYTREDDEGRREDEDVTVTTLLFGYSIYF